MTFVQHIVDCRFPSTWCFKTKVHQVRHLQSQFPKSPNPDPILQVLRQARHNGSPFSAGGTQESAKIYMLLSSICFNMCKPVLKHGDTEFKNALGPHQQLVINDCTDKTRSDQKKYIYKTSLLRRVSCRCMLQIITVTLSFCRMMLMIFLHRVTEKPERCEWSVLFFN